MGFEVSVNIRKSDLTKIAQAREKFMGKVEEDVQEILERTAEIIYKNARRDVPVDTGHLKSTINKEVKRMFVAVWVGADYAPDVEFDTVKYDGKKFFRDAIKKGEAYMRNSINQLER